MRYIYNSLWINNSKKLALGDVVKKLDKKHRLERSFLSFADRITPVKAAALYMPLYAMSSFKLPSIVCVKMDSSIFRL